MQVVIIHKQINLQIRPPMCQHIEWEKLYYIIEIIIIIKHLY